MELINKLVWLKNPKIYQDIFLAGVDKSNYVCVFDLLQGKLIFNLKVSTPEIYGIYKNTLLLKYSENLIKGYRLSTGMEKYQINFDKFKPNRFKVADGLSYFLYLTDNNKIEYYDFRTGVKTRMFKIEAQNFQIQDMTSNKIAIVNGSILSILDIETEVMYNFNVGNKFMFPKFITDSKILIQANNFYGILDTVLGNFTKITSSEGQRCMLSHDKSKIITYKSNNITGFYDLSGNSLEIIPQEYFKQSAFFNSNIYIVKLENSLVIYNLNKNSPIEIIRGNFESFDTEFSNFLVATSDSNVTNVWNISLLVRDAIQE